MKSFAKLIAIFIVISMGATAALAVNEGNPRKGRFLYQKNCRTCHGEGGEAARLSPSSKTQAQWQRFFERDGHKKNSGAWERFSPQDLEDLKVYLHDSAADSPKPESCG